VPACKPFIFGQITLKNTLKKILSEPITQRITPESLGQFFANSDNSYEDFDDFTGINRQKSLN
jgi:hypothetical protein